MDAITYSTVVRSSLPSKIGWADPLRLKGRCARCPETQPHLYSYFVLQDMFELASSANYAEGKEKLNARQSKVISFSVSKKLLEGRQRASVDARLQ